MNKCILVVDTGSSSMRSALVDAEGQILFLAKREYFMSLEADGSCEMSPQVFREALFEVCKEAALWAKERGISPVALSLTSQRSSVLAVDEEGQPLGNVVMWHDKRSAKLCEQIQKEFGNEIYKITGTHLSPILSAPKMAMLSKQYPEVYKKAWKLLGIHDYLLTVITGHPSTDISLASRSCLMDVEKGRWSLRLLKIFGVSKDKLCRLLLPGDQAGEVSAYFSERSGLPMGLPVVSAGGDQQCSVAGQGLTEPGQLGVTVGTGAYACMVLDRPKIDKKGQTNLNAAVVKGRWVMEASTYCSGLVYNWFNENFYEKGEKSYKAINEAVQRVPPGSGGVLMLPYLSGKGCPEWDPYARGMFCNLSTDATKDQFARAAQEGVASEVADCIDILAKLGDAFPSEINVAGGLAKFPVFAQMLSDMSGYPVRVLENGETTILGAWMQGAVSMGMYRSQREIAEKLSIFKVGKTYGPVKDNKKIYERIHHARKRIYESVPMKEISGILMGLGNE